MAEPSPVKARAAASRSAREAILRTSGPAAQHAGEMLAQSGLTARIEGPRAAHDPVVEWATSGAMALTGPRQGPPAAIPRGLALAARGAGQAIEALAPEIAQAQLDWPALLGERAAIFGLERQGAIAPGGSARLLGTRNGPIVVNLPREDDWSLVPAWLEMEGFRLSEDRSLDWKQLGEHLCTRDAETWVERGRLLGLAVAAVPRRFEATRPGMIEGAPGLPLRRARDRRLRVLDFSALWAGPLAGSLLERAGCDVIKIESPERPDGARTGPKPFFDLLNAGKRSAALDLRDAHDRRRLEQLFEEADVVLESSRPRALEQLGYAAADWVSAGPGRIWASITGYGRSEPERDWIAFGDDAAVAAGLAWAQEPGSEPAGFCGDAIADPLTGLAATVAILAYAHDGRGGLLDLSMRDIAAHAARVDCPSDPLEITVERSTSKPAADSADASSRSGDAHETADESTYAIVRRGEVIPIRAPRARAHRGFAPALTRPEGEIHFDPDPAAHPEADRSIRC